jgi:hypothetical protein
MATRRRSLERGDEKPHRLHVQLPKRRSWLLTSEQGLGSLHEPHVLFSQERFDECGGPAR